VPEAEMLYRVHGDSCSDTRIFESQSPPFQRFALTLAVFNDNLYDDQVDHSHNKTGAGILAQEIYRFSVPYCCSVSG